MQNIDIGLVLSGGGARCFAQLGVLRAMEERGVRPVAVAACSTAAVLGALVAHGYASEDILQRLRALDGKKLVRLEFGRGLMKSDGIAHWLEEQVPATFEELALPFAVVAVDIQRGELLEFRSGPLMPAVLGSNAFPGLFHPVEHDGRFLMDGGILNEVPVDLIRTLTDRKVIAVDVTTSPDQPPDLERTDRSLWKALTSPLNSGPPLALELMRQAYVITRQSVIDARYAAHPPDLIIRPELGDQVRTEDFDKLDEAVQRGYERACEVLDQGMGDLLANHPDAPA